MTVVLNGTPTHVGPGSTLADLVVALALPDRGVALALDGEVVPRRRWCDTGIRDGACVEVVTAMQGG
jgi:sulfur carrier protein